MYWQRLTAWTLSEIRQFGWLWIVFPFASMLAASLATYVRIEARSEVPTGILELTMVLVVLALTIASKQATEMRAGTLRHVLAFPLQPSLLLCAKLVAFLAIFLIVLAVGFTSAFFVLNYMNRPAELPMFAAAFRLICVCTVVWSVAVASDSWPIISLFRVVELSGVCIILLVLFPALRHVALHVLFVGSTAAPQDLLLGALFFAGVAAYGLTITIIGLRVRNIG